MKKLLFAVSALAALSLLAPSSGLAQPYFNQIGLYADEAGTVASYEGALYVNITLYVVISNPYDYALGGDVASISGVEYSLTFTDGGGMLGLPTFPVNATNIGTVPNVVAGFALPVTVPVSGVLVLTTYTFFTMAPCQFFLDEVTVNPSVPGFMAIVNDNGGAYSLVSCHPASSSATLPVFDVNVGGTIATEESTLDSVKALYR